MKADTKQLMEALRSLRPKTKPSRKHWSERLKFYREKFGNAKTRETVKSAVS